jgi:hypothetical protein
VFVLFHELDSGNGKTRCSVQARMQPLYAVVQCAVWAAHAQGTVRANLSGLPAGQALNEQFANRGIHFLPAGNLAATTVRAPEFLPASGETLGRATMFFVRFDRSITSFAFDIAPGARP